MSNEVKVRLTASRLPNGRIGVTAQADYHGTVRSQGRNIEEAVTGLEARLLQKMADQTLRNALPQTMTIDLDELANEGVIE